MRPVADLFYAFWNEALEKFRKHADTDTDTDMITVPIHVSHVLDFVSQNIGTCMPMVCGT